MRTLVEHEQGPRARARRRREGASTTTAGCWRCPTRGAGHPRLGRGRRPTPRPAAWPRSTPGASASCCAETAAGPARRSRGRRRPASVRRHERARRPPLLAGPRVGPARGRPGPHRHHRLRPGRARRRRVRAAPRGRRRRSRPARRFSEVESTKSVSDIYAPVAGTVVEVNADLADAPERLNEDPYGEGWICVIEPADAAELDALLDADGLPGAHRGLSERGR